MISLSPLLLALLLLAAVAVGAAIARLVGRSEGRDAAARRRADAEAIAAELGARRDTERRDDINDVVDRVKAEFGSMSFAAIGEAQKQLIATAKQELGASLTEGSQSLESKKAMIDQTLGQIRDRVGAELEKVSKTVTDLEKDREGKFKELSAQLANANQATRDLSGATASLREALSSTKARGAWGERIAEEVLHLAGFVEGTSYEKQKTQENQNRPDFTFLMPNGQRLNMDVKFPLENYQRYLDAGSDDERKRCQDEFVRDARRSMKAVVSREYIDPGAGTLDYVLLFIPNEQVYGFLHESDRTIADEALKNKVILCSPFTLYAVLALIRQTIDSFNVQRTSREILLLLADFQKQWEKFKDQMDKMGTRIDDAKREFESLKGTRSRALERPLSRIGDLRTRRGESGDGQGLIDPDLGVDPSPDPEDDGR